MIVEAHTVGQDDWTTLPDVNGHTTDDLSNDLACTGGWSNPADAENVLHPFLTHYQTFDPATSKCSSTGSTGKWHAANGSSPAGSSWRWISRLRGRAGRDLDHLGERLGLRAVPGVFLDDIVVSTGEGSTSFEDDADPIDGWEVTGAPQTPAESRDPTPMTGPRTGSRDQGRATVATDDSLYLGFGLEGVSDLASDPGTDDRNQVMASCVEYLVGSPGSVRVEEILGLETAAGRDAECDVATPPLVEGPV